MRRTAVIATSAVTLALAGTLIPTQAQAAKVKFGSALDPSVQPSNSLPGLYCDLWDFAAQCSFVQNEAYGRPDGGERAPQGGTLKKIRVIAGGPGSFTLQLVRSRLVGGFWQSRVKAVGPTIDHVGQTWENWAGGTYRVETFRVNMPIRQGWRLAVRSTDTSAVRCSSGGPHTLIHNPALTAGDGFSTATGSDGCWLLVEGVIRY